MAHEASRHSAQLKFLADYALYEFNDKHSKELASFYNPLSSRQVQDLEALLRHEIDPIIAPKGIRLKRLVGFTIE